jgi:hypothetical protein
MRPKTPAIIPLANASQPLLVSSSRGPFGSLEFRTPMTSTLATSTQLPPSLKLLFVKVACARTQLSNWPFMVSIETEGER